MKRNALGFLITLLLILITGCTNNETEVTVRQPLPQDYKQVVDTIKVVERKTGKPTFSLEAQTLIEYNTYVEFQNLGEVLTYSQGNPELRLSSDTANWFEKQSRLEAIGNVEVNGIEEDFRLKSPKVIYKTVAEQFEAIGRSTVITTRFTLSADKVSGDVSAKILTASGNLELLDRDGLEVTGSSLEFNWETQSYSVKGPITAKVK